MNSSSYIRSLMVAAQPGHGAATVRERIVGLH